MFMVEDPCDEHFVFCELTGVRMFKSRAAVDQHIHSQLFSEAMASIMADIGPRWVSRTAFIVPYCLTSTRYYVSPCLEIYVRMHFYRVLKYK